MRPVGPGGLGMAMSEAEKYPYMPVLSSGYEREVADPKEPPLPLLQPEVSLRSRLCPLHNNDCPLGEGDQSRR